MKGVNVAHARSFFSSIIILVYVSFLFCLIDFILVEILILYSISERKISFLRSVISEMPTNKIYFL